MFHSKRELSIDVVHEQLVGTIYEQSISPAEDTMAERLDCKLSFSVRRTTQLPDVTKWTSISERRDNFAMLEDWPFL